MVGSAVAINQELADQMQRRAAPRGEAGGDVKSTDKRVDSDRYKIGNIPKRIQHDEYAAEQWHYLVGELRKLGMLMAVYRMPLMAHCINVSLFLQAHDRLEDKKEIIEKDENSKESALTMKSPNGYEQMSTDLVNYRNLHDLVMKGADEFGLTPKARAKILKDPNQLGIQFNYNH